MWILQPWLALYGRGSMMRLLQPIMLLSCLLGCPALLFKENESKLIFCSIIARIRIGTRRLGKNFQGSPTTAQWLPAESASKRSITLMEPRVYFDQRQTFLCGVVS